MLTNQIREEIAEEEENEEDGGMIKEEQKEPAPFNTEENDQDEILANHPGAPHNQASPDKQEHQEGEEEAKEENAMQGKIKTAL